MKTARFPNTDLEVSRIGFGCWGISGEKYWTGANDKDSIDAVNTAIEYGVNFFDVAPIYGFGHAEEVLGKALKYNRKNVIIASKCGLIWDTMYKIKNDLTSKSLFSEIDASLKRLGTDYIDLYQIHWPDYSTHIEETMEALNKIKKSGKIRYIGLSNFPIKLANDAMKYSDISSEQCLYNMFDRNEETYHNIPLYYKTEEEMLPYCREKNIGFIPYSPLCQGLLTGKFNNANNFANFDVRVTNSNLFGEKLKQRLKVVSKLKSIGKEIEKPVSQIALNWLIENPVITTVICGSLNSEQSKENSTSPKWDLNEEIIQKINALISE